MIAGNSGDYENRAKIQGCKLLEAPKCTDSHSIENGAFSDEFCETLVVPGNPVCTAILLGCAGDLIMLVDYMTYLYFPQQMEHIRDPLARGVLVHQINAAGSY